VQIGNGTERRR